MSNSQLLHIIAKDGICPRPSCGNNVGNKRHKALEQQMPYIRRFLGLDSVAPDTENLRFTLRNTSAVVFCNKHLQDMTSVNDWVEQKTSRLRQERVYLEAQLQTPTRSRASKSKRARDEDSDDDERLRFPWTLGKKVKTSPNSVEEDNAQTTTPARPKKSMRLKPSSREHSNGAEMTLPISKRLRSRNPKMAQASKDTTTKSSLQDPFVSPAKKNRSGKDGVKAVQNDAFAAPFLGQSDNPIIEKALQEDFEDNCMSKFPVEDDPYRPITESDVQRLEFFLHQQAEQAKAAATKNTNVIHEQDMAQAHQTQQYNPTASANLNGYYPQVAPTVPAMGSSQSTQASPDSISLAGNGNNQATTTQSGPSGALVDPIDPMLWLTGSDIDFETALQSYKAHTAMTSPFNNSYGDFSLGAYNTASQYGATDTRGNGQDSTFDSPIGFKMGGSQFGDEMTTTANQTNSMRSGPILSVDTSVPSTDTASESLTSALSGESTNSFSSATSIESEPEWIDSAYGYDESGLAPFAL